MTADDVGRLAISVVAPIVRCPQGTAESREIARAWLTKTASREAWRELMVMQRAADLLFGTSWAAPVEQQTRPRRMQVEGLLDAVFEGPAPNAVQLIGTDDGALRRAVEDAALAHAARDLPSDLRWQLSRDLERSVLDLRPWPAWVPPRVLMLLDSVPRLAPAMQTFRDLVWEGGDFSGGAVRLTARTVAATRLAGIDRVEVVDRLMFAATLATVARGSEHPDHALALAASDAILAWAAPLASDEAWVSDVLGDPLEAIRRRLTT